MLCFSFSLRTLAQVTSGLPGSSISRSQSHSSKGLKTPECQIIHYSQKFIDHTIRIRSYQSLCHLPYSTPAKIDSTLPVTGGRLQPTTPTKLYCRDLATARLAKLAKLAILPIFDCVLFIFSICFKLFLKKKKEKKFDMF